MNYYIIFLIIMLVLESNLAHPNDASSSEVTNNKNRSVNEVQRDFPYILSGYDEDGAPIWVLEVGKYDFRKYVDLGGNDLNSLENHTDKMIENFRDSAVNSTARQVILFGDLEGWNIRQMGSLPTLSFIMKKASIFVNVLKEGHVKKMYGVNANFLFRQFYQLVKPVLGRLVDTVEMFGSNKETWIPKILKELPRDQLPEWYGGSKGHLPVKIYS